MPLANHRARLEHLLHFIEEPEQDIPAMSTENIGYYLDEEGIDLAPYASRLRSLVGQHLRPAPSEKRRQLEEALNRWPAPKSPVLRRDLWKQLWILGECYPAVALAYLEAVETESDAEALLAHLQRQGVRQ